MAPTSQDMTLKEVVALLNQELQTGLFKDYCPNGIQVDASRAPDALRRQAPIDKVLSLEIDTFVSGEILAATLPDV